MFESFNYWISILIMMVGLFGVITRGNLVKKMISLAIFQVSVLLFYISVGTVERGAPPIRSTKLLPPDRLKELKESGVIKGEELLKADHIMQFNDVGQIYANPLPHVLMLTAIVVGVAVIAVGLAIIVRIKEEYGTIEEDEILKLDQEFSKMERENS